MASIARSITGIGFVTVKAPLRLLLDSFFGLIFVDFFELRAFFMSCAAFEETFTAIFLFDYVFTMVSLILYKPHIIVK